MDHSSARRVRTASTGNMYVNSLCHCMIGVALSWRRRKFCTYRYTCKDCTKVRTLCCVSLLYNRHVYTDLLHVLVHIMFIVYKLCPIFNFVKINYPINFVESRLGTRGGAMATSHASRTRIFQPTSAVSSSPRPSAAAASGVPPKPGGSGLYGWTGRGPHGWISTCRGRWDSPWRNGGNWSATVHWVSPAAATAVSSYSTAATTATGEHRQIVGRE